MGRVVRSGLNIVTVSRSIVIPPGGYVVFARSGDPLAKANGGLLVADYVYSGIQFAGSDLALFSGSMIVAQMTYPPNTGKDLSWSWSPEGWCLAIPTPKAENPHGICPLP